MLRVFSTFKTHITIDGEEIPIIIKRLTPEESVVFTRDFGRFGRAVRASAAAPPPEETDDAYAARLVAEEADEVRSNAFATDAITRFLSVEAGHLSGDDQEITTGADFVRFFAVRDEILASALWLIYFENKFSEPDKVRIRAHQQARAEDGQPAAPAEMSAPMEEVVAG